MSKQTQRKQQSLSELFELLSSEEVMPVLLQSISKERYIEVMSDLLAVT